MFIGEVHRRAKVGPKAAGYLYSEGIVIEQRRLVFVEIVDDLGKRLDHRIDDVDEAHDKIRFSSARRSGHYARKRMLERQYFCRLSAATESAIYGLFDVVVVVVVAGVRRHRIAR